MGTNPVWLCLHKKKFGQTETPGHTENGHTSAQQEGSRLQAKESGPEENKPADTLTLDFQLPDLWKTNFLVCGVLLGQPYQKILAMNKTKSRSSLNFQTIEESHNLVCT